jgi:gluconate 2-dehydrogenase gamma chain
MEETIDTPAASSGISRRSALRALGSGLGAATLLPLLSPKGIMAFEALQRTQAAPQLLALTQAQYATVEAFTEAIIPADAHSPGAKAARVADYIDLLLSESDEKMRQAWVEGLELVDASARAAHNTPFVSLSPTQVETMLTEISRNERDPQTDLERFFRMTKDVTIRGYYTSEIGIHEDLKYQGNQFLAEFVGCKTEDGEECPHCGQKP